MTSTAAPIETGQAVVFQGRRYTVAWICYNVSRCPCGEYCNKADLDAADGAQVLSIRECQLAPAPAQMLEGETKSRTAGRVVIAVTRVAGPYNRYRAYVAYDLTLREVDGLAWAVDTYERAAAIGNALAGWFHTGITAQQAIDALPVLKTIATLAA